MRSHISLYIDGQEVQFQEVPQILFTYAYTDIHNPTVIKNSFTKTITVDGCPKNEKIFGCFGDMTKIISYADGKYSGAYFNPSRKVDFILYDNGNVIERGYVKLDKVIKKGKNVSYEITLYGGLGQMLYNLTYGEEGKELKLSDLEYSSPFNMEVNKNTVKNAWERLTNPEPDTISSSYDIINFVPCYNGIPQNFSADKMAIYADGLSISMRDKLGIKVEDGDYSTINGWMLGELPKEYDEWQTKDLRSYLQRPVIRFKEIIQACCNPVNNGGYEVDLDSEFFSTENPYYDNAWMTLPLVNEMEVEEETPPTITLTQNGDRFDVSGGENGTNITFKFDVGAFCRADSSVGGLTTNNYMQAWDGSDESSPTDESTNVARIIQIVAYDADGSEIGKSPAYAHYTYGGASDAFYFGNDVKRVNGIYRKQADGNYMFGEEKLNVVIENLTYSDGMYFKINEQFAYSQAGSTSPDKNKLYYREEIGYDDDSGSEVYKTVAVSVSSFYTELSLLENKVTKKVKEISKKTLLNTDGTPCDYFLNYLKMFNLHIWADNMVKKVYVRQRKTFFTNNRMNIDNMVDRGSEINITPLTFDAKWYIFNNEINNNSYMNKAYNEKYGFDYGIQKIDTNYNFDNSQKVLIDKNVYKSIICQRGKSKYYVDAYLSEDDLRSIPPCFLDGCNTFLFNGNGDTVDGGRITPKTSSLSSVNWYEEKGYDAFPKPDFRDKDGKPIDGANVLLFYNGKVEMDNVNNKWMGFYLTDDIPEFDKLNEGEPCWIYVGGDNGGMYSFDVGVLPEFSRYLTDDSGNVTYSWDFGTPKEIYIDDITINEEASIYNRFWKDYMNDELDVNTRIVECKMRLTGNINPDYMQSFIYFDGCYWRIQEIVDYDVSSNDFTKVKLVKINNLNSYLT